MSLRVFNGNHKKHIFWKNPTTGEDEIVFTIDAENNKLILAAGMTIVDAEDTEIAQPPTGLSDTIELTDGDLVVENGLIQSFTPAE